MNYDLLLVVFNVFIVFKFSVYLCNTRYSLNILYFKMDPKAEDQPMVTEERQNEIMNDNNFQSSVNMDISTAFRKIATKDPPRYTELSEAVNRTFEEISDSISPEEFKNILGDISFLRNKKNATNLLSTLKTQLYDHMSKNFETIKEDENLCELFDEKSSLDEKTAKKYLIDKDAMELFELEESLSKLNGQIAELEETNEVLFELREFKNQRFESLSQEITTLTNKSKTKYKNYEQQFDTLKKGLNEMIKDQ